MEVHGDFQAICGIMSFFRGVELPMSYRSSYNPFCISSFLAFRYVVQPNIAWKDGVVPTWHDDKSFGSVGVRDSHEVLEALSNIMDNVCSDEKVGILLSGGIDSGILATLMPEGSYAYTIRFEAENAVDEVSEARVYAERRGLHHQIVTVDWHDYEMYTDHLMLRKKSPLHPVEVALFKAALQAKSDGLDRLIAGTGADCTFGGLDKLLSRDWTVDEFVDRYTFVKPELVLHEPMSMRAIFSRYATSGVMDVLHFLAFVHGPGLAQAFQNGIVAAGCDWKAPYEMLRVDCPLNIDRIRAGESKYLLREVFSKVYPNLEIPPKIAFPRPMDTWMEYWVGPKRSEFLSDLDVSSLTGEQKWLIYCLERFMNLFEDVNADEPTMNNNEFAAGQLICSN